MAYTRVYENRINWENYPELTTPIDEINLNKIDYAVHEIDGTLENWDVTKANESDMLLAVKTIVFNDANGQLTITFFNGTSTVIDTLLEKVAVNFDYDDDPTSAHYQSLVITLDDGTIKYVDMSALITQYEFIDSSTMHFTINADGEITVDIIDGSITGQKLQPNYLADCQEARNTSISKAADAATSESNAEAWANGTRGGQPVTSEDPAYHNNAKYWKDQANPTLLSSLQDVYIDQPQDDQELRYDATLQKWKNSTSNITFVGQNKEITNIAGQMQQGFGTCAIGDNSHAEGASTSSVGDGSHAEGDSTRASAQGSHAEGYKSVTSGTQAHAEGYQTSAKGTASHSEGYNTRVEGQGSHAEGQYSTVGAAFSHAEGRSMVDDYKKYSAWSLEYNIPLSDNMIVSDPVTIERDTSVPDTKIKVGILTISISKLQEEKEIQIPTVASLPGTMVWEEINDPSSNISTSQGYRFTTDGRLALNKEVGESDQFGYVVRLSTGDTSVPNSTFAYLEYEVTSIEENSVDKTYYLDLYLKLNNSQTKFNNIYYKPSSGSLELGNLSFKAYYRSVEIVSVTHSHAEGYGSTCSMNYSHAEGFGCLVTGGSQYGPETLSGSHAEGISTTVTGKGSHAEGYRTSVNGTYSHAEGYMSVAPGDYAHAEGYSSTATAYASNAQGYCSITEAPHSLATGENGKTRFIPADENYNSLSLEFAIGGGETSKQVMLENYKPVMQNMNSETQELMYSPNIFSVDNRGAVFQMGENYIARGCINGRLMGTTTEDQFVLEDGAMYFLHTHTRLNTGAWRGMTSYIISATFNPKAADAGKGTTTTAQAIPMIAAIGNAGTVGIKLAARAEPYVNSLGTTAYHSKLGISCCLNTCRVRYTLVKISGSEQDFNINWT